MFLCFAPDFYVFMFCAGFLCFGKSPRVGFFMFLCFAPDFEFMFLCFGRLTRLLVTEVVSTPGTYQKLALFIGLSLAAETNICGV